MSRLHNCSTHTISLIRKLLVHVIRDAFYVRFGFRCPQHLQRIRDLSLLPHILHTNRCWMDLSLGEVASLFDLSENDFELCLHQPNRLDKWEGAIRIANPIGTAIIDYRLKSNGSLPTRMRTLFSWNINSWRTFLIPRITSYEDVNGFLGRVQSACKRQSGQAGTVSTSISKFQEFVSIILQLFAAGSVLEQGELLYFCHLGGLHLKSLNWCQVELLL